MTDFAPSATTARAPRPKTLVQGLRGIVGASHVLFAGFPVAVLLMVPDSEVHAKVFKFGMILDNFNRRVLMSLWT